VLIPDEAEAFSTATGLDLGAPRVLNEASFTHVLATPANMDPQQESPLHRAILSGLLDAGVRGTRVASLWVRPYAGGPLSVFVSVEPKEDSETLGNEAMPLVFPLGARGVKTSTADVLTLLAGMSWRQCGGQMDPLLIEDRGRSVALEHRWKSNPLDDVSAYMADVAFAWLISCDPWASQTIETELGQVRRKLFGLRQSRDFSQSARIESERCEGWFRELSQATPGGIWNVSIWAGAQTDRVSRVASLLSGAAQQSVAGCLIRPWRAGGSSDGDHPEVAKGDEPGLRPTTFPFAATSAVVAALVRPPETELPGLRVVALPDFDTTPELPVRGKKKPEVVEFGAVLDRFRRPSGPLPLDLRTVNKHIFVCGATGGGKSQTVRTLLESLSRHTRPIPWLVIEPAKAEYARMAGRIADLPDNVLVISPGDPDVAPGSLNPLEPASREPGNPAETFPLQSHADLVRALFLAAFQGEEPFPQVLSQALRQCYEAAGWDLVTGEPLSPRSWDPVTGQPALRSNTSRSPRFPALGDLQLTARRVVDEIGYAEDIRKNVRGFVDIRLGSLRHGTPGRFFEGGHPLDFDALLKRNVVLEIEGITNDQDKAFFIGTILIRLYEQLMLSEKERSKQRSRERKHSKPCAVDEDVNILRHVTVVEEAHRLLRKVPLDSPASHSLELFANVLAEVRAYGEGIIIAEQIPSKLILDVIKNTALKIVHRLPAADDRTVAGATMNLSERQSQYVVTLEPGAAAVFADEMDRPVLMKFPDDENREDASAARRTDAMVLHERRSRSCGQQCLAGDPCTLRQMRDAEHLLDAHPEMTLWFEMGIAAHGIGDPAPGLKDVPIWRLVKEVYVSDPRQVQCSVAHAAEAALATRYARLAAYFDPDALGQHLSDALLNLIANDDWGETDCSRDDGRWRFGRQRFGDLEEGLRRLHAGEEIFLPHNALVARARERGLSLVGNTVASDFDTVLWQPATAIGSNEMRLMLFGDRTPASVVSASLRLMGPGDAHEQVRAASRQVLEWKVPKTEDDLIEHLFGLPARASTSEEKP
jgi:hypothetical protein